MSMVTFVLARLDEDAAVARAAAPLMWEDTGPVLAGVVADRGAVTVAVCNSSDWDGGEYSYPAGKDEAARSVHIARHDPARVLRDIEAKRRVVAEFESARSRLPERGDALDPAVVQYVLLIKLVGAQATVHSDHPDYDPAWALEDAR